MKKLIIIIILSVPVYVWSQGNIIFNPGFDMTPWDTGWSINREMLGAELIATPCSTKYCSSPQSCSLYAHGFAEPGSGGDALGEITLSQTLWPIASCTCRVNIQYYTASGRGTGWASAFLRINNKDSEIWGQGGFTSCTTWVNLEKFYSDTDTVSAILFRASAWPTVGGDVATAMLLIDDVYIGGTKVGVEEKPNIKNQNISLKTFPNPFIRQATIKYYLPAKNKISLTLYDLSGICVKTLVDKKECQGHNEVKLESDNLSAGVYFIKLETPDYIGTEKLILMK